MVILDLADASWFPLMMVIVIGVVMYLLYRSMRHEIGKISVPKRGRGRTFDDSADT